MCHAGALIFFSGSGVRLGSGQKKTHRALERRQVCHLRLFAEATSTQLSKLQAGSGWCEDGDCT